MNRHWTTEELTERLYGIREADTEQDQHLESCGDCNVRFEELNRRRAATAVPEEISTAQWAAQRGAVLERISQPARMPRWVPALTAAACLVAVAVFAHRPAQVAPVRTETAATITDAQLFADVYNIEESAEPLATEPMHALFEEAR